MKTLKESLLNSTDNTLQAGDDYFGINTFPSKKDFKRNSIMKGYRCTWICPAIKDIYENELKSYLRNSIRSSSISSWILQKYDEINGISVHVQKAADKIFRIEVYLEGIDRGSLTDAGVIMMHIFGERDTMAKAKDAAYEFLCKIKDNEQFFKEVLKHGENKLKWII